MTTYVAHSPNKQGIWHELLKHLHCTADGAKQNGEKFFAGEVSALVGLTHDLGKYGAFQAYLHAVASGAHVARGPDHSSAGAVYLWNSQNGPVAAALANVVAGHHRGLVDRERLERRMGEKFADSQVRDALKIGLNQVTLPTQPITWPAYMKGNGATVLYRQEMWERFVFSALVDADFLDTARHFDPDNPAPSYPDLTTLAGQMAAAHAKRKAPTTPLGQLRNEIYSACLAAAPLEPGLFRLTVPTGGGKTLSGLAFALTHAVRHGLDRVIVVIPYTSIIEQTVAVYRDILGDEAVVEHHSAVHHTFDGENPDVEHVRARLAAENWDAPLVVTTSVQFLESLFANMPARCRKLHNIARSVIVFDEAQMLPTPLLAPTLDVLQTLVDHYGASVVLSTATQPALTTAPGFNGLRGIREIVPEPARFFGALQRVRYELPPRPESWAEIALRVAKHPRVLAIANTKRDARALVEALEALGLTPIYLSTQLCGAHRRDVLVEIKRLKDEPCLVVSTQVVEAGVDLDFPVVFRALGPLDRVVQAAGRCNREGKLPYGTLYLFEPNEGRLPSGVYRTATDETRALLGEGRADFHDPDLYEDYFRRVFASSPLDSKDVQAYRKDKNFPEVARRYRLIPDDTIPVVVHYKKQSERVQDLLVRLRFSGMSKQLLREFQPYLVNLYEHDFKLATAKGLVIPVAPGLYEWRGSYGDHGLELAGAQDPEFLVV